MSERKIDEILESLWSVVEEGEVGLPLGAPILQERGMSEALEKAQRDELITVAHEACGFTDKGRERARSVVRRHRLAERLLHDVLSLGGREMESAACRFEHLLSVEATNSICILLGHPSICPHAKPIPTGECCKRGISETRPLVIPASLLRIGEEGKVAYVGTKERDRLDRLATLGILPGNKVTLEQRRPSYVLRVDETQLGLDDAIVQEIYVRRMEPHQRGRRRWG